MWERAIYGGVAAQAVAEFEVLVQQVQKNAALVEHAITAITHARACAAPPAGTTVDLQELQEHIENHRIKVWLTCSLRRGLHACCRHDIVIQLQESMIRNDK